MLGSVQELHVNHQFLAFKAVTLTQQLDHGQFKFQLFYTTLYIYCNSRFDKQVQRSIIHVYILLFSNMLLFATII